jgi:hypothetical protein
MGMSIMKKSCALHVASFPSKVMDKINKWSFLPMPDTLWESFVDF